LQLVLLLCFTLCAFVTKRKSNFYFWTGNVFPNLSSDFVLEWPNGEFVSLSLASFCLGQKHLYVKMLFTGSPLFRSISEILHWLQVKRISSLSAVRTTCHPVWTLTCPLFHPPGRHAIPSGRQTDQASSVWTTWISI
jgi:hypothetical protein